MLYQRIVRRKCHQKGMDAVARHLVEAAFYVLSRKWEYRFDFEPAVSPRFSFRRRPPTCFRPIDTRDRSSRNLVDTKF